MSKLSSASNLTATLGTLATLPSVLVNALAAVLVEAGADCLGIFEQVEADGAHQYVFKRFNINKLVSVALDHLSLFDQSLLRRFPGC